MEGHCNVLLLALSTFPNKLSMSENKFIWENGKEYTGIYQLDPVPKMLADQLSQEQEYLDKIILLATDPTFEEEKDVSITYLDGKKTLYHGTELQYFISQIESYMNPNIDLEEKFIVVPVDPRNIERGISDTIDKLREIKNIRLYLDTHGGFREIFLVAEAVISLLKIDKIEVQGIYGIEYGQEKRIVDARSGFHIFDFVAGMNEFMNYGRSNSLEDFFRNNMDTDPQISMQQENLLLCIKKISEGIQLCSIFAFEQGLDELTKYYKKRDLQKELRNHSYLFLFAENIKDDYGNLLKSERTVIDEIEWCMKKGFYQQVLTLIESRVPKYLKRVGICEYRLEKGKDETMVFNQCIAWRYYRGMSSEKRLGKMDSKWYPRQEKKGENGEYLEDTTANVWIQFNISEEKRSLLDEYLKTHMKLKDIRNQLNHALNTYNKGLIYVKEKVEKYLKILESLCS